MNLSALIVYTRDLTGVYSTDVVSDALVIRWLNESYFEVERKATWPWTATALVSGTDVPDFDEQFHSILPYRAAVKVLNFVSDDSRRSETYGGEFSLLLQDLQRYYLSGEATGSYSTAGSLVRLVRDLTGVYDGDAVSDALLLKWVNDAQFELARQRTWPWSGFVVVMGSADVPAFSASSAAQFNHVLAYRAAARLVATLGSEGNQVEVFIGEYGNLVVDMEKFYFTSAATGVSNTLSNMIRVVRDLTTMYSAQTLPDSLIRTYLNNGYNELARRHDWVWLELVHNVSLPASVGGVHTVVLPNGTRRVLEAYVVLNSGEVREMVNTPNLASIEVNQSGVYYDIDFAGNVTIKPVLDNVDSVKFRYLSSNVDLVDGSDVPAFDVSFNMILPYRASIAVLSQMAPGDPRSTWYETEYTSLYEGMYSMYQLIHDNRSFQLGEDGVQTRRYYPQFRPS